MSKMIALIIAAIIVAGVGIAVITACLAWHGQDGKVHDPRAVRRHILIKKMEGGAP